MPSANQHLNQLKSLTLQTAQEMVSIVDAHNVQVMDDAQEEAFWSCHPSMGAAAFETFCDEFVIIWDRETKADVALDLFESQRLVTGDLCSGTWLVLLKGRQLGLTWLLAAFVVWRITYSRTLTVVVVNQQKDYAKDFIKRVKYIYGRLPVWMQKQITTDNKQELVWERDGNNIVLRAIVGGEKASRSMTVDLAILDEASRIPDLDDTMAALQPGVESAKGQIVALSSSAGPQGYFHESWQGAYGEFGEKLREDGTGPNGFKPVFIRWNLRRGRDEKWYAKESERLGAISPVRMKQEHPDNPQEAWEFASGRVYPLFTRNHCIGDIDCPLNTERYRSIDWGQTTSAHVCLWIAHVPGPPGLLVSPACPNTIREFFAYRWDEDKPDEPMKKDDHCPDAVRYAITTFNLTGLVYIYREIYVLDSVEKGWNIMSEIEAIHRASGWEPAPEDHRATWWRGPISEAYEGTVADRSWSKAIATYCANDIPCRGHRILQRKEVTGKLLTDRPLTEKLEGIRAVASLIDGSIDIEKRIPVTRERLAMRVLAETRTARSTTDLERRSLALYARRLLAAQRKGRRS